MNGFCFKSNWLTEYSSYKQLNIQSFIAIFWNVSIDCSISKSLRLLQSTIWNENSRCVRLQIKDTENFSNKNVKTIYSFFVNVTIVQCQTTCCFCKNEFYFYKYFLGKTSGARCRPVWHRIGGQTQQQCRGHWGHRGLEPSQLMLNINSSH